MQIHFGRTLTIAAFAAFALGGCGSKDSGSGTTTTTTGETGTGSGTGTGTGAGTGSGTGSGTGTGTGSATGGTDAFGRMVNLIWDGGGVDIHLNDDPNSLNSDPFVPGGNTDGSALVGYDYAPFPTPGGSFAYNVKLRQSDGTDILDFDTTLVADEHYTILAMGTTSVANSTLGVSVDDSANNSPTAGSHALSIWQANPGFAAVPVDIFACAVADADADGKTDPCPNTGTAVATAMTFPNGTGVFESTETATFVTLYVGGLPFAGYELDTPADAWSYLYIGINFFDGNADGIPDNPAGTPWAIHHKHGIPNDQGIKPAVEWGP